VPSTMTVKPPKRTTGLEGCGLGSGCRLNRGTSLSKMVPGERRGKRWEGAGKGVLGGGPRWKGGHVSPSMGSSLTWRNKIVVGGRGIIPLNGAIVWNINMAVPKIRSASNWPRFWVHGRQIREIQPNQCRCAGVAHNNVRRQFRPVKQTQKNTKKSRPPGTTYQPTVDTRGPSHVIP